MYLICTSSFANLIYLKIKCYNNNDKKETTAEKLGGKHFFFLIIIDASRIGYGCVSFFKHYLKKIRWCITENQELKNIKNKQKN